MKSVAQKYILLIELRSIFFLFLFKCISEKLNFENRKWKTEKAKFEIENVAMNSAKIQLFVPKDESSSANSRFVSWLFQFLSEFLSLNRNFSYICDG